MNTRAVTQEIGFMELGNVLCKQWKTIAVFAAVGAVVGVVTALTRPTLYASKAVIEIGKVGAMEQVTERMVPYPIEPMALAIERVRTASTEGSGGVRLDARSADSFITLIGKAANPQAAKDAVEQAVKKLLAAHQKRYDAFTNAYQSYIDTLRQDVAKQRALVENLDKRLDSASGRDAALGAAIAMHKGTLLAEIAKLERARFSTEMMMNGVGVKASEVVDPPSLSDRPVSPRYPYFAGLGALLGLCIGMIYAVYREFFRPSAGVAA
ncbi:MAG: hypothetical protein AB7F66_03315 [Bacteriovoracia bacterium]